MIEIPTPYLVPTDNGDYTINPAVLEAQRANYYNQRVRYEGNKMVGTYQLDGTLVRFGNESKA
jgi:hypothetical protein